MPQLANLNSFPGVENGWLLGGILITDSNGEATLSFKTGKTPANSTGIVPSKIMASVSPFSPITPPSIGYNTAWSLSFDYTTGVSTITFTLFESDGTGLPAASIIFTYFVFYGTSLEIRNPSSSETIVLK